MRNVHVERRKDDMNPVSILVDPVEAAMRRSVTASDVVAVIGKLFAGREARRLTDNLIAFNNKPRAVGMHHDPFPTEQRNRAIGGILNRDEVNKRVRFVRRQARAAVVIAQLVQ
jgi:hypothetical protein